jgi:hypothetical protein
VRGGSGFAKQRKPKMRLNIFGSESNKKKAKIYEN